MGLETASYEEVVDCYLHMEYTYGFSLGHLVLRLPGRQNWERPLLPHLVIPDRGLWAGTYF